MASPARRALLAALALLFALAPSKARAQLEPLPFDRGASGLSLALRKVGVTGRVLYVTAHPDDEHNGVLVRLSRGLGLRTALLTVTRGEGGQNAIGGELFEALGVLRTEELMALHRYDGVEQSFGRAYEFGFSFSVEETLGKWGHEETLRDIVRVVRAFRPDVILTLPLEGKGGGQHHQAVARLTREAFRAAADPARFPEQIAAGLRPWQALKLYQGGAGGFPEALPGTVVHVPTGVYDPLLGMTWQELGSLSRTMHRCQGAGQLKADPGPAEGVYALVDRALPSAAGPPETDILDGVDTTVAGLARLAPGDAAAAAALVPLEAALRTARTSLDPAAPERSVPALVEALRLVRERRESLAEGSEGAARADLVERLRDEEQDLERALVLAHGLVLEARADDGLVTPGETFGVTVSVWNGSAATLDVEAVELEVPPGWTAARREGEPGPLRGGGLRRELFDVTVAPDAAASRPYWTRSGSRDRFDVDTPAHETLPWSPPDVVARVRCRIGGVLATLAAPAVWRYPGPFVGGEKKHVVTVVPELSLRTAPEVTVVQAGARAPIDVRVFVSHDARGPGEATVRLEAPRGWAVEPPRVALRFAYEGEEIAARFRVRPPAALPPGTFALRAVARRGGREYREGVQAVAYDHIQRRQLVRPAETRVLVLDVSTRPGVSVGYVMGSGDGVADAIRQLRVPVTLLTADDLAFGDLSRFTTIVTGIRAYETRADLRSYHPRLLRWVEGGGHLVVQYNRDAFNRVTATAGGPAGDASPSTSPFVPYPAVVTAQRISDETAPVRLLAPRHPLLTAPNRIGAADWEGWVQERGIQFLDARDPRYVELLAATDPFPFNPGEKRGMLVEAKVGEGTWTYVGLGLFRQVPAGVPGGWRLLANLVSRPRGR